MRWHTFYMGGAAAERTKGAQHSHAVALDTMRPLCHRVRLESLVIDESIAKPGEMPTCPVCARCIQQYESHETGN